MHWRKVKMAEKMIILILLSVFIIAAISPRIAQKLKHIETVGCIGIDKRLFVLGKLSLFTSFALILVQTFVVNLSLFGQNAVFLWICIGLVGAGVAFFSLAIIKLGTFSLRVGLAKEKTVLQTTGVYRISRNPMLVGLFLIALGAAVYVQNPINWLLVVIALLVHHKIITTEEKFMATRFGDEWLQYGKKVRRYL